MACGHRLPREIAKNAVLQGALLWGLSEHQVLQGTSAKALAVPLPGVRTITVLWAFSPGPAVIAWLLCLSLACAPLLSCGCSVLGLLSSLGSQADNRHLPGS